MATTLGSSAPGSRSLIQFVPDTRTSAAEIQADVRQLILDAPFELDEDDISLVQLESQLGDRRRIDVEVGATSTIDRGTYGPTIVGEGTKIDNQVMIGHNAENLGDAAVVVTSTAIKRGNPEVDLALETRVHYKKWQYFHHN